MFCIYFLKHLCRTLVCWKAVTCVQLVKLAPGRWICWAKAAGPVKCW